MKQITKRKLKVKQIKKQESKKSNWDILFSNIDKSNAESERNRIYRGQSKKSYYK